MNGSLIHCQIVSDRLRSTTIVESLLLHLSHLRLCLHVSLATLGDQCRSSLGCVDRCALTSNLSEVCHNSLLLGQHDSLNFWLFCLLVVVSEFGVAHFHCEPQWTDCVIFFAIIAFPGGLGVFWHFQRGIVRLKLSSLWIESDRAVSANLVTQPCQWVNGLTHACFRVCRKESSTSSKLII